MSMTIERTGGRLVLEKIRSLRTEEALRERDSEMYRKHCEGHTYQDIATMFGRTKGLVSQRFAILPSAVKRTIRKDVANIRAMRLENLREGMEANCA